MRALGMLVAVGLVVLAVLGVGSVIDSIFPRSESAASRGSGFVIHAQPQQPVVEQPVTPPQPTTYQCPGTAVGNGGCLVPASTDVPAGACVDYDPRSTGVEGPHVIVFDTGLAARAKMTGPGRYVGQYPATVYPRC